MTSRQHRIERLIEGTLATCALLTVLITGGIIWTLFAETAQFFRTIRIVDFLTDTEWTPLFVDKHFGVLPLLTGTLLTTLIALLVAVPMGVIIAVYLREYAGDTFRQSMQPLLEVLAAVPTVVYGFFALTVVTPFLQHIIPNLSGFNALSSGIVMGIMIIPLVTSLSEDALMAVPESLRLASYGLGATRLQTAFRVMVPSASSGIVVSLILAFSRAVGETMIVAVAAGQQPRLTLDPRVPIETITAYIVQVSQGDVARDSLEYRTIYAAGMALFVFTFTLNNLGYWIRTRYGNRYD